MDSTTENSVISPIPIVSATVVVAVRDGLRRTPVVASRIRTPSRRDGSQPSAAASGPATSGPIARKPRKNMRPARGDHEQAGLAGGDALRGERETDGAEQQREHDPRFPAADGALMRARQGGDRCRPRRRRGGQQRGADGDDKASQQ